MCRNKDAKTYFILAHCPGSCMLEHVWFIPQFPESDVCFWARSQSRIKEHPVRAANRKQTVAHSS